jgi:hypothetical protein
LFSSVDFLLKALDGLREPDTIIRYLTFSAMVLKGIWLVIDHVLWTAKANLMKLETSKLTRASNWIWLAGILLLTIRDIYNIKVRKLATSRNYRELAKNACDVMLPVGNLDIFPYHDRGTAGLFGIISSLIGAYDIWVKLDGKKQD